MSSPPNRSPGKGGKSLDQLRKAQTADPSLALGQSQPESSAPSQVLAPPTSLQTSHPQSSPLASSRPKGKDFASLSARQPPPQMQPPQQQPTTQQALAAPVANPQTVRQGPTGGKPKGKDFSQMASRMGPSTVQQPPVVQQPPPPQPQPFQRTTSDSSQQAARAAQMQAAARAAAGMPPLDRSAMAAAAGNTPNPMQGMPMPGQLQQPTYSSQQQLQQQQQQQRMAYPNQQQPPPAAAVQRRPSLPTQLHRTSSSGGMIAGTTPVAAAAAPVPPVKKTRENSKPTPTPTIPEARVLGPATVTVTGAHRAPLLGPRIQQLVAEVDPNYTLDAQAEEQLLRLADDFLDKVCSSSLKLAQHRGSKVLDVQDVQMVLQKQWKITIPGLPLPPLSSTLPMSTFGAAAAGSKASGAGKTGNGGSSSALAPKPLAGSRRKASGGAGGPSTKLAKTGAGDVKSQT